ncbi:MAG: SWIM zinc finger family protein, partial [Flavobacteriaceae bacterium]
MVNIAQLETLTSAGLVRRAKKSLDKNPVTWKDKDKSVWTYSFDGANGKVNLSDLESSQCDCPAEGLCKHIVAAAISSINEDDTKADFAPPKLNLEELFEEAGKVVCRKVFREWIDNWKEYFAKNEGGTNQESNTPPKALLKNEPDYCSLSWENKVAILGSGGGLSSITVEGGDIKDKLTSAVIYTALNNDHVVWPTWLLDEEEASSNRIAEERSSLKHEVKQRLISLVSRGVRDLVPSSIVELTTLALSLKSAGERRIGNGILSLSTLIEQRNNDQGLDPSVQILQQISMLYSLCDSSADIQTDQPDYFEHLNLLCLGGHQWINNSGSIGLSMVFLSDDGKLYSASLMRNKVGGGFSPQDAWSKQTLWSGASINSDLPGRYFALGNATLNRWNSLSLSTKTLFKREKGGAFEWQAITDWMNLKGVSEFGYALLKVKRWISCDFDEVNQELVLQVEDDQKQVLIVSQKYTNDTENRIANLLDHWSSQAKYLLVRHVPREGSHTFEPISMYDKRWLSLDFMKAKEPQLGLLSRMMDKFKKNQSYQVANNDELSILLSTLEIELSEHPYSSQSKL